MPFGPDNLVFKVCGKMFALNSLDTASFSVNLKCDPEYALELRDKYSGIQPGYHMNKQHWNTVNGNEDVPDKLILELTDHSYDLVVSKLPAKIKTEYGLTNGKN
ncbi:MAG TPA: MmcQ/YjbR family DNA-binding protein [Saprospiraceae bacterium]|nr:MmcQ/YjbR family DNA-binding protein [Saprospiraceae bacterium]